MTFSIRWRWGGSIAALSVLAMFSALMPTEARAGCSHPWVKVASTHADLSDLDALSPGGAAGPTSGPIPNRNHRSPCAGGACSRLPERPVSQLPSVSTQGELWGELRSGPSVLVPQFQRITVDTSRLPTVLSLSPLERPPRDEQAR
jgi:hypothetical protein